MRFTEACLLKTENNMTTLSEPLVTPKYGKWRQLVLGLICMAAISSPQYVWTLLTKPLAARLGVGLPELQVTFSLLIILQTFFSFSGAVSGKIWPTAADRYWHGDGGNELGAFAQVNAWQRSGWFMAAWAASGPGSSTSALSA
jgi:hypothetical protein